MSCVFGWAICRPVSWTADPGAPTIFTVSRTRADAIKAMLDLHGPQQTWKLLYRQGWRARHVEVRPILFGEDRQ